MVGPAHAQAQTSPPVAGSSAVSPIVRSTAPAAVVVPEVVVEQAAPKAVAKAARTAKPSTAAQSLREPTPALKSKKAVAVPAAPKPVAPTPVSAETVATALAGTLIVQQDAFAPVTIVAQPEFQASSGATLTDSLALKPGIAGSSFAAGASRPIIRGLDNNRVRVQENGVGVHDVSALSEDHAVPIDPNGVQQVEVIRGPATLRYGSNAIGGVVSGSNDRIPEAMPTGGVNAEVNGGVSSAGNGRDGAFRVTAGAGNIVLHADGFERHAGDYDTPAGRQANSFVDGQGYAFGGSIVGNGGFIGASVQRYTSLYGIPGGESATGKTRIDMVQDKVTARGEWRVKDFAIEAIRVWFGASDYAHNELRFGGNLAVMADFVGSRFTVNEREGRVEAQHLPIGTALGELRGAAGLQWGHRRVQGQSFEGGDSLLEPATTDTLAAFIFEELQMTRQLRLQAAARIENTQQRGIGLDPADPSVLPPVAGDESFNPKSASLGALYELPLGVVARLMGQYTERAPDAAELFSKGPHEATGTFEIGSSDLVLEKAQTLELGFKRATGAFRFDTSAYYSRFDGFIFKELTGRFCDGLVNSCGTGAELKELVFKQRDATFYGVELAGQYDVAPIWNGVWGIEGQYDFVHAQFVNGENAPRIPPHRLGGGLFYRDASWSARVSLLHAFAHNQTAPEETITSGYDLLNAEISTRLKLAFSSPSLGPEMTIGLKGENLLNDDVRNSVSFKKDDVLQPGISVRLFGSIKLN
ncbi:MAG: TonB-dependent receptor [Hyphomicrobiaceae bacterium]